MAATPTSELTDSELVAAMARGDRAALGELYDRLAPSMLAVATRILSDKRAAEDLLHDVFLEIWRKAASYSESRSNVKTWCLLRLRSRALDRLRARGRSRITDAEDAIANHTAPSSFDPSRTSDHRNLATALDSLSNSQRQVLELAYFEGLSGTEIAERLNIPLGTVKSRSAAALRNLRAVFDPL